MGRSSPARLLLFAVLLHGALPLAAGQTPPKASAKREVAGLLLLTSDKVVADASELAWRPGEAFDVVQKRFPAKRFAVREWGKRSMIVIDLRSGPIGVTMARVEGMRALGEKIGSDGFVDFGSLSRSERESLSLQGLVPPGGTAAGLLMLDLRTEFAISYKSASKTGSYPVRGPNYEQEAKRLDEHLLVQQSPPSPSPKDEQANEAKYRSNYFATMHLYGIAYTYFSEGMAEGAKAVDEILKQLRQELGAATVNLLNKTGHQRLGLSHEGELRLNDLPTEARDALSKYFAASWNSAGFSSQLEAETFLQNCDSLQPSTSIGLRFVTKAPGGPGHPGTGGTISFARTPGIYQP